MPVLKYKINGKWVELSGGANGGGNNVQVDPTLSVEGMAADAKITGDAIAAVAEVIGNAVTQDQFGEVIGAFAENLGALELQISEKQNRVIFNSTQPDDWQNGDIWLKPAE